jgi:hypothetical protein
MDYSMADDTLLVTYSDGSVHVVYDVTADMKVESPTSDWNPLEMTQALRNICFTIEGPDTLDAAVMQTFGGCFPFSGVALWAYQYVVNLQLACGG